MNTKPVELFQKILCPVDFSGNSRHALQYAALLARRADARLIALFVEDPLLAVASAGMGVAEATLVQKEKSPAFTGLFHVALNANQSQL